MLTMMLISLLCLLILAPHIKANLLVQYKITLDCNFSSPHFTGCLRGMTCDDGLTCTKPMIDQGSISPSVNTLPRAGPLHSFTNPVDAFRPKRRARRQNEPAIEPQNGAAAAAPAAVNDGPVTVDGTCGASNGGTVCGNWDRGSCCSLFGVSLPSTPQAPSPSNLAGKLALTWRHSFAVTRMLTAAKAVRAALALVRPSRPRLARPPPLNWATEAASE